MPAPVWESKGTILSDTTGAPTFVVPSGVEDKNILIVSFFMNGVGTVTNIPSGFSQAEGSPVSASNHSLNVYWKRATGADAGTYDFTLSGSTFVEGIAERYSSCKITGNPFDSPVDTGINNTNSSTTPAVDVTTLGPDRKILHRATIWSGGTWTPPSALGGFDERVDEGVGLLGCFDKTLAVAGNTGSIIATSTGSDKTTAWAGALIGTTTGASMSISDEARTNMLAELALTEPQLKSNTDLMKLVLEDVGQTTVTKTDASAATHLERYLVALRNS